MRLAEEVLARDLFDPLWPGLTESDWEQDAKLVARAYLWAEAERDRYRTLLRRALVYLPDNSTIACDVKAALRVEDRC